MSIENIQGVDRVRSEINQRILSGEFSGRYLHEVDPNTEDIDFDYLYSPILKTKITKLYLGHKSLREIVKDRGGNLSNGFILFGSWINGAGENESDLDVIFLRGKTDFRTRSAISGFFNNNEYEIIQQQNEFENYKKDILQFLDNPGNTDKLQDLMFMLLGIPFGNELQLLIEQVLKFIDSLNDADRKKLWDVLSQKIYEAETGRIKGLESGYVILDREPKSFSDYKKRFERRCEFANSYSNENGLFFD